MSRIGRSLGSSSSSSSPPSRAMYSMASVNDDHRYHRQLDNDGDSKTPMLSSSSSSSITLTERDPPNMDIDDLEITSPDHDHDHDSGPLLTHYQRATSSIRKDYSTVDWYFSKYQLVRVRRLLREENVGRGWKGRLMNAFIAAQGWLILMIVGILTALSASFIHLVAAWLGDLKTGYCTDSFFATRRICCMEYQVECSAWKTWSDAILTNPTSAGAYTWNYFVYLILSICCSLLACWVVRVYCREAAGSGIAEIKVILGGFVLKRFLGIRTLFIKSVALILSVASGLSLGKEGPLVHVAACWGNILSRRFTKYANEVKRREILSASVAAGVSAAFGAPLGGVLFSLECVSSYFPSKTMWRSFWCAITSAILLQYFDPFQTGKLVQFAIRTQSPWYWMELVPFVLLGLLGGCLGALFVRLNVRFTTWRRKNRLLRSRPLTQVAILTLLTALLNYSNIFMRGSSTTLLAQLFTSCSDQSVIDDKDVNLGSSSVVNALCNDNGSVGRNFALLLLAGLIKYMLTIITYGAPVPAGVFVPALTTGACLGRCLGWALQLWYEAVGDTSLFHHCAGKTSCISPNIYALIGATAMLGGITRMTVSLAVIMFEVTGGLDYIVPIMVAVVCSRWVGDSFGQPLYNRLIEHHGWPYIDADLESIDLPYMHGRASDLMAHNPVCVTAYSTTLRDLRQLLASHPYHGFPILNNENDRQAVGFIARSDIEFELENVNEEAEIRSLGVLPVFFSSDPPPFRTPDTHLEFVQEVDKHPIHVLADTPVERVVELFISLGLRYVLVTTQSGKLLGLIKKKDLLLFLHAARQANRTNNPFSP